MEQWNHGQTIQGDFSVEIDPDSTFGADNQGGANLNDSMIPRSSESPRGFGDTDVSHNLLEAKDALGSLEEPSPPPHPSTTHHHAKLVARTAELEQVRHRLRAAAYTNRGVDMESLFRKSFDLDHNGLIDVDEFSGIVRRVLKIPISDISDTHIDAV